MSDLNRIQIIRDNIFPGAWEAIEDWDTFRWHRGAYQKHSSQALAIDFFGTFKNSKDKVLILNQLAKRINLPISKNWEVDLEWRDPDNILCELSRAKTQVDAVAISENSLIFFECKFTERDGGSCYQPRHGECNGSYEDQVNPINNVRSKCALWGKASGTGVLSHRSSTSIQLMNINRVRLLGLGISGCAILWSALRYLRNGVLLLDSL